MKLNDYKPKIEYMAWDKQEEQLVNIKYIYFDSMLGVSASVNKIGRNYTYLLESCYLTLLPYTNCKDMNNNKLYLFDVVEDKEGMKCLIIYPKDRTQYILFSNDFIDCEEIFYVENFWMAQYKRLGSIYEFPELQKEFNIEV